MTAILCSSCGTAPARPEFITPDPSWFLIRDKYEPAVKEILSSQRKTPMLWLTTEAGFTSEHGIHVAEPWAPQFQVMIHELAHWHNPHLGELPAIVEEGVALTVVYELGFSAFMRPPEILPPFTNTLKELGMDYPEFASCSQERRWMLATRGFGIVNRIGLDRLLKMSDVSPEAIALAAGLK